MKLAVSIDSRVLERKLDTAMTRTQIGRHRAALAQADSVIGFVAADAPRDTNRLVRSYIQAGNRAGLRQRPMPPLKESSTRHFHMANADQAVRLSRANIAKAERAVAKWEKWRALYQSQNRQRQMYYKKTIMPKLRKAHSDLRFHTRRLEAAVRAYERIHSEEGKYAIVLGGFGRGEVYAHASGGVSVYAQRLAKSRTFKQRGAYVVLKRNINVQTKIQGGSGRVEATGTATFVHLTSHEPHVRVVQRKTRFMTTALQKARSSSGAKRYTKRAYEREVLWHTGWSRRRAA